jgi:Flp pilus assembly protein TadG
VAEFAIVAVPLLLLLLGILQFGIIYNTQVGLTNAIRDAARFGSGQTAADATSAGSLATATYNKLASSLAKYVSPYDAADLDATSQACVSQHADGAGAQPAFVRVTAVYDHPLFIPLVGPIIDGLDGTSDNAFRISATTELRVDNPAQATVAIGSPECRP